MNALSAILAWFTGRPATPTPEAPRPGAAAPGWTKLRYAATTLERADGRNDNYFSIDADRSMFFIADGKEPSASDPDPALSAATSFNEAGPACGGSDYYGLLHRLAAANATLFRHHSQAHVVAAVVAGGKIDVDIAGPVHAYLYRGGRLQRLITIDYEDGLGSSEAATLFHSSTVLAGGDQVLLAVGLAKTLGPEAIEAALARPAVDLTERAKALAAGLRDPDDDVAVVLIEAVGAAS